MSEQASSVVDTWNGDVADGTPARAGADMAATRRGRPLAILQGRQVAEMVLCGPMRHMRSSAQFVPS